MYNGSLVYYPSSSAILPHALKKVISLLDQTEIDRVDFFWQDKYFSVFPNSNYEFILEKILLDCGATL